MGGTTYIITPVDIQHCFCIFGSGDVWLPDNHIGRARMEAAYVHELNHEQPRGIYAFFGCHQPGMAHTELTEADTMEEWFNFKFANNETSFGPYSNLLLGRISKHGEPEINSISTTCAAIVTKYLAKGAHVHLVINWIYIPRTYYLMYKQAKRLGLNWNEVKHLVHMVPCGGTYLPYVKDMGFPRATLWWLKKVLYREAVKGWGKAILDPYSEKYNQNRTF